MAGNERWPEKKGDGIGRFVTRILQLLPVSRFECVSGLSVYPVEIRSVNNLSSSEDCSIDYCQPV